MKGYPEGRPFVIREDVLGQASGSTWRESLRGAASLAVMARRPMYVRLGFDLHVECAPEEKALGIQVNALRDPREPVRDQDLDVVLVLPLIARGVFAAEISVDRHLRLAASTKGRDVVQGHDPALLSDERLCFR